MQILSIFVAKNCDRIKLRGFWRQGAGEVCAEGRRVKPSFCTVRNQETLKIG